RGRRRPGRGRGVRRLGGVGALGLGGCREVGRLGRGVGGRGVLLGRLDRGGGRLLVGRLGVRRVRGRGEVRGDGAQRGRDGAEVGEGHAARRPARTVGAALVQHGHARGEGVGGGERVLLGLGRGVRGLLRDVRGLELGARGEAREAGRRARRRGVGDGLAEARLGVPDLGDLLGREARGALPGEELGAHEGVARGVDGRGVRGGHAEGGRGGRGRGRRRGGRVAGRRRRSGGPVGERGGGGRRG